MSTTREQAHAKLDAKVQSIPTPNLIEIHQLLDLQDARTSEQNLVRCKVLFELERRGILAFDEETYEYVVVPVA